MTPQQLRHRYATELANAGVSLPGLMVLLGHVTRETTLRSATLASRTLRAGSDATIGHVRRAQPSLPMARLVVPDRLAWIACEFLTTRVATGFCSRRLAAGPCAYADACETCENSVPVAESCGAICAQRVNSRSLRYDAIRREGPSRGNVTAASSTAWRRSWLASPTGRCGAEPLHTLMAG
ncbi:MAG TPA: hypothetical protein VMW47_05085 [Verrucomicrobiae bacterium]|nr:hypothetical protein [Verrucomicrobiae bacterium]